MLITTEIGDTEVECPVVPGEETHISALGTFDGATVTIQALVDGQWFDVPDGEFTAAFEIVRVNGDSTRIRAAVSDVGAATSIAVNLTSLPMP